LRLKKGAYMKRDTCHEAERLVKAGEVKAKGKERPFAWQVDIRWRSWIVAV
jgi:hypothetical protein